LSSEGCSEFLVVLQSYKILRIYSVYSSILTEPWLGNTALRYQGMHAMATVIVN